MRALRQAANQLTFEADALFSVLVLLLSASHLCCHLFNRFSPFNEILCGRDWDAMCGSTASFTAFFIFRNICISMAL